MQSCINLNDGNYIKCCNMFLKWLACSTRTDTWDNRTHTLEKSLRLLSTTVVYQSSIQSAKTMKIITTIILSTEYSFPVNFQLILSLNCSSHTQISHSVVFLFSSLKLIMVIQQKFFFILSPKDRWILVFRGFYSLSIPSPLSTSSS